MAEGGKVLRYIPDVSMGTLLQIVAMFAAVFLAYSALKQEVATQQLRIEQIRAEVEKDRTQMKESLQESVSRQERGLNELKADVKEVSRNMAEVNASLAVLKAKK